jgi:hypothetical protein
VAGINFDDYLISFEIRFQRNLRRSTDRAIARLRSTPKKLRKNLQEVTVGTFRGGGPITFRAKIDVSPEKWEKMAKETELLRDALFSGASGGSELGRRMHDAIQNVWTNAALRFLGANLNVISGNLVSTMVGQEPQLYEAKTVGVQAAVGNIGELNAGTPFYTKTADGIRIPREYKQGGPSVESYSYDTARGQNIEIKQQGYWAFQEFGTSNGVRPRSFILSLRRDEHIQDAEEFADVQNWIFDRIALYNRRAASIMR